MPSLTPKEDRTSSDIEAAVSRAEVCSSLMDDSTHVLNTPKASSAVKFSEFSF